MKMCHTNGGAMWEGLATQLGEINLMLLSLSYGIYHEPLL
jgi:hypothetical protein